MRGMINLILGSGLTLATLSVGLGSPLTSSTAWAAGSGGINETTGNTNTNGTGRTSTGIAQPTATAPTAVSQPPPPSINQSAKQGNSSQMIGGLINGAVGTGLIAWGTAQKPPNQMMIMMGVMALGQAAASLAAAGQSSGTGDASVAGWGDYSVKPGAGTDPTGIGGTDNPNPGGPITPAGLQNQIKDGLKTLAASGMHVDLAAKTVTMPDGTIKSLDDIKDAASMAAAGFSPSQSSAALAAADKLTKEAIAKYGGDAPRVVAVGTESGGESGGGGYSGSNDDGMNNYMGKMRGLSAADKARMIAGKSIMAGGEPIGVKGDDIFQMIHRHYDMKRKGNEFIEIAEASPVMRSKASIQKGFIAPRK